MVKATELGALDQQVLLALMRLDQNAYGRAAWMLIIALTGREACLSSVYASLGRLERAGYIVRHRGEPRGGRGQRSTFRFEPTRAGLDALTRTLAAIDLLRRDLGLECEARAMTDCQTEAAAGVPPCMDSIPARQSTTSQRAHRYT
jgi:DNA-binding PadR family transcriptional regulator